MAEVLTAVSCLIHIGVHLKKKRLNYKILYYESAILLAAGLLSWDISVYQGYFVRSQ